MINVKGLSVRLGGKVCLRGVDLETHSGELVAIIGPNGAGKSTLLKAISGELEPDEGQALIDGRSREQWQRQALARQMAVMGQAPSLAFDFTVRELVELGRAPHRGSAGVQNHRAIVDYAIRLSGLAEFADRLVPSLSGGERQRAFFAKAIAQLMRAPDTLQGRDRLLLLDEPTSALDLAQQVRVMGAARAMVEAGGAVLAVLHDLNLTASYADRVAVLFDGELVAYGPTQDVLKAEALSAWYGCPVDVLANEATGRTVISVIA